MRRCYFYPGQGAQYPGMAKDLYEFSAEVRRVFELADDATGMDCRKLLFDSSEDELKATDVAQVAIALVNKSASVLLQAEGLASSGCAGFSLGEYSALNDAGVIGDADMFRIIRQRGEIMERVSRRCDTPAGPSGMAACIGLELGEVVRILERMRSEGPNLQAYPGLHNGETQTVISGTAEALARAEALLTEAGAMKYVLLKTSGPFHSPLMTEASRELAEAIEGCEFRDPGKVVYSNVTGKPILSGAEAKRLCAEQLVSTVRWVDVQRSIVADAYDAHLEVGPGSVLSGLWKRFQRGLRCQTAGKLAEIQAIKESANNA